MVPLWCWVGAGLVWAGAWLMVVVGGLMVGMFGVGVPDTYNLSYLSYGFPFSNALALACCPREGNGIR